MRLGVTGTSDPSCVTPFAKAEFSRLVLELSPTTELHHGGCQGGDETMHHIIDDLFGCPIHIHQPDNKSKVAFFLGRNITLLPSKPYLERNKDIVKNCDVLIAMPKTMQEELRSGTWMTVRNGVLKRKKVYIVWPDGTSSYIDSNDTHKPLWWVITKWPRTSKSITSFF